MIVTVLLPKAFHVTPSDSYRSQRELRKNPSVHTINDNQVTTSRPHRDTSYERHRYSCSYATSTTRAPSPQIGKVSEVHRLEFGHALHHATRDRPRYAAPLRRRRLFHVYQCRSNDILSDDRASGRRPYRPTSSRRITSHPSGVVRAQWWRSTRIRSHPLG